MPEPAFTLPGIRVHLPRNRCSRSPESVFTMLWNGCSPSAGICVHDAPEYAVLKPVRFQRAQAGAWDLQRAELSRPVRMKAVGLAVVGLSLVLLQCCGGRTTAPTEDPGETTTSATTEAGTTAPTTPAPGAEPTIIIDASAPAAWVEDFNGGWKT